MKILLILPCMKWLDYGASFEQGRFWKSVLSRISSFRNRVDIYAIDCIRLESTGQMIGLWSPYKDKAVFSEIFKKKLDNYPAWTKYKNKPKLRAELREQVRKKLVELSPKYDRIISFTNVKVYYYCLQELADEFDMIILPRKISWMSPRALKEDNYTELEEELMQSVIMKRATR